jgi:hypothetical protein
MSGAGDDVTERLAKLRSGSAAEHHRNATKQRRHRGHKNRPKPHDAGLIDGFFSRQSVSCSGMLDEIDQHDEQQQRA